MMQNLFENVKDWLEVWALFIPLIVLLIKPNQPGYIRPVIIYIIAALILNILIDVSWKLKPYYNFPDWFKNNNHFYNIHSIVRLLMFSWFFINIHRRHLKAFQKAIPLVFILFILINFIYFQSFWMPPFFSARLHAIEAGLLLVYCLEYYFFLMHDEQISFKKTPSFWVVTGLSIFVVVCFPIYLFYKNAAVIDIPFVINIWQVQKLAYLVFCIFISIAFYETNKTTSTRYK